MPGATLAAAATVAATGVAAMTYAVRHPHASLLAPSFYRGVSDRRSIALTFDDGPSESTPALLDILDHYRVKATFFQVGANVRRLPAIARMVADSGHEIGNHSDTHPLFALKPAAFILADLRAAQQIIAQHTGVQPRLLRAPYGVRWFGLRRAQAELGLTGVMWTVIGRDWKDTADAVTSRLLETVEPGGIVCLHDGRERGVNPDISVTLETVRRVLPHWIGQGFSFETASQISCQMNCPRESLR